MSSRRRVVLVDDSADIRLLVSLAVEDREGVQLVGEAEDGYSGLRLIQRLRPDVAVVDVHMPKMSGVELIKLLRFRGLELRIIAHSNDEDGLADALRAGADLAVMKSASSSALVTALAN